MATRWFVWTGTHISQRISTYFNTYYALKRELIRENWIKRVRIYWFLELALVNRVLGAATKSWFVNTCNGGLSLVVMLIWTIKGHINFLEVLHSLFRFLNECTYVDKNTDCTKCISSLFIVSRNTPMYKLSYTFMESQLEFKWAAWCRLSRIVTHPGQPTLLVHVNLGCVRIRTFTTSLIE